MRRWTLSLGMGSALVGLLAIGMTGSARAATLDFTGTLSLRLATLPAFVVPGAGTAQVSDDGSAHLLSFLLPGGTFGPKSCSVSVPVNASVAARALPAAPIARQATNALPIPRERVHRRMTHLR